MPCYAAKTIAIALLALATFAGAAMLSARAQDRGASSEHRWQAMNDCNKNAFAHYPDYTVQGAAQREAFVRKCLRDQRLPPWTGYSAPVPSKP